MGREGVKSPVRPGIGQHAGREVEKRVENPRNRVSELHFLAARGQSDQVVLHYTVVLERVGQVDKLR